MSTVSLPKPQGAGPAGPGTAPSKPQAPGARPAQRDVPRDGYQKIALGDVKGTLLIARMKYLRSRGPEDAERVLRRMLSTDQKVLGGMLLPSSWYPADLLLRLEMTTAAILSQGDRKQLFLDMGRFTADTNLGPDGVQRPYVKPGEPHFLLRNIPRMYSAQHSDGSRTYEETGPKSAVVKTISGDEPTAEDCLTAAGWLKRAVELSGGRAVTVEETACRARGGACCEYVCRWA